MKKAACGFGASPTIVQNETFTRLKTIIYHFGGGGTFDCNEAKIFMSMFLMY